MYAHILDNLSDVMVERQQAHLCIDVFAFEEYGESLFIAFIVYDRRLGHARLSGCLADGDWNFRNESWVKRRWNHIVAFTNLEFTSWVSSLDLSWNFHLREFSEGLCCRHLHALIDLLGVTVERCPEKVREAHDIVDLVREV